MKTLGGAAACIAAVGALATPAAAQSRRTTQLSPYIEAAQVLSVDLNGGETLTYTQLSAGLDATTSSQRMTATIAVRYDRNIAWDDEVGDQNVVTGLARVTALVAPGLSIDGGAIATRSRADIRGAAPGLTQGNLDNTSQVVSADIGPSYVHQAGPVGIAAGYRFGGTEVSTPTDPGLAPGARRLDRYDNSTRHLATVSAGVKPNTVAPVGLSASGAYEREDVNQLDQKYEGYYGRGDVVLPVTPVLALTAGAGYEKIETSQRDPVVDAAGNPVVDAQGRYVTNDASPRRIAFETRGLFWDAGVLYRPNPRTTLQARVGRRYDTISYTGSLAYQASANVGLNVGVYDGIQSFGRQLRGGVAAVPANFIPGTGDPLGRDFTGCSFGQSSAAAGGCLTPAFQSITTAQFRARGVDAVLVANRGVTSFGLGAGYAHRRFYLPDTGPAVQAALDGLTDQSWYAQAFASHQLSPDSGIDFNAQGAIYDSGLAGADTVYTLGASSGYYHRFGNLGATASVGVFGTDSRSLDAQLEAQARLGLRYGF